MFQKTIRKQLLHKTSLNSSDNVELQDCSRDKKVNKMYSTSGLKKELNNYKELSAEEHKKTTIYSSTLSRNQNEMKNKIKYTNNKHDRNRTRRDLEIMKILTSLEWSQKTVSKTIVNIMANSDTPMNAQSENITLSKIDNVADSTVYPVVQEIIIDQGETEETDYVGEHQNEYNISNESLKSGVPLLQTEERDLENDRKSTNGSITAESITAESITAESITAESITAESIPAENSKNVRELSEASSFNIKTQQEYNNIFFETSEEDNMADESGSRLSLIRTTSNVDASEKSLKVYKTEFISNEEDVLIKNDYVGDECHSYWYEIQGLHLKRKYISFALF